MFAPVFFPANASKLMQGFIQETIHCFVLFLFIRLIEARFSVDKSRCIDQTERIKGRLSPAVVLLLDLTRLRIFRVLRQRNSMIAQVRLIFPKNSIYIDYGEDKLLPGFEDFVISHEIAHAQRYHLIIRLVFECLIVGLITALAIVLTVHNPSFIEAAAIAIPIILIGTFGGFIPFNAYLKTLLEIDADRFAANITGQQNAIQQLGVLKDMFPTRIYVQKDLDNRLKYLTAHR